MVNPSRKKAASRVAEFMNGPLYFEGNSMIRFLRLSILHGDDLYMDRIDPEHGQDWCCVLRSTEALS